MWTVASQALCLRKVGPLFSPGSVWGSQPRATQCPPLHCSLSSKLSELTRYLGEYLVFSPTGSAKPWAAGSMSNSPLDPIQV